jgi:hypothetical protein
MNHHPSQLEPARHVAGTFPFRWLRWPGERAAQAGFSPRGNALLRRFLVLGLCTLSAAAPQRAAALSPTVTSLNINTGGTVQLNLSGPVLLTPVQAHVCQNMTVSLGILQSAANPLCNGNLAVPVGPIVSLGAAQYSVAVPAQALQLTASTGAARPRFVHLQLQVESGAAPLIALRRLFVRIDLIEPTVILATGPRITEAQLRFVGAGGQQPVGFFALDQSLPPVEALLRFQGSGLIRARWEVVQPGDPEPSTLDLTPATQLSLTERAQQRRWRAVGGVQQHYFSTSGLMRLAGPPPRLLPSDQLGAYTLLLRLEPYRPLAPAQSAGPAGGAGGAAGTGFVMPVLRYYVGTQAGAVLAHETPGPIHVLSPQGLVFSDRPLVFTWQQRADVSLYRVELERAGELLYAARVLPQGQGAGAGPSANPYGNGHTSGPWNPNESSVVRQALPTWLQQQLRESVAAARAAASASVAAPDAAASAPSTTTGRGLRWRVVSVGAEGEAVSTSRWVDIQWVD